jgi:multidrug efflux pump subunit AcrB
MNRALGLTSIFGLITLMGMIMRNEILIFEHAIDLLRGKRIEVRGERLPQTQIPGSDISLTSHLSPLTTKEYNAAVKKAAYDAGKRRMVPIFLTTATTAVGVVPMIIAQSSFWMPVGVTIFAGGIGSLIMVVTMLPVVYWKVSTK